mmetsp:Transcript_121382/g.325941  ORF Transcript_121382/g.325941 Transcript_121382/m.325941 type:complete len:211 (+) Transcript_121382:613-1245(+)
MPLCLWTTQCAPLPSTGCLDPSPRRWRVGAAPAALRASSSSNSWTVFIALGTGSALLLPLPLSLPLPLPFLPPLCLIGGGSSSTALPLPLPPFALPLAGGGSSKGSSTFPFLPLPLAGGASLTGSALAFPLSFPFPPFSSFAPLASGAFPSYFSSLFLRALFSASSSFAVPFGAAPPVGCSTTSAIHSSIFSVCFWVKKCWFCMVPSSAK